jgi:hypothetical protein
MNENLKNFKEEVANGRPRLALEHAVKLFEKLFEEDSNKIIKKEAVPKKVAAKKVAAIKEDSKTEEDGNTK